MVKKDKTRYWGRMKDLLLNVSFLVHVELHDTDSFLEMDLEKMMDKIQRTVEADSRCKLLMTKNGGGFVHRILYQKRGEC